MSDFMRAWRFHTVGKLDSLSLDSVPQPELGPGEVLVRIEYAALNPADYYLILGQYPRAGAPPFTVGRDGSGTVVRAPQGSRFHEGERVVLLGGLTGISKPGTLAEYAAIPEAWLAPLPEGWTAAEGAAASLVFLTAWLALVREGNLKDDETLLVTGASGGVGTAAVILAKALHARVVALSRSEEKRQRLAALGADITLDSRSSNLEAALKEALGTQRVDLVVETLGGPYLQLAQRITGFKGRIMVVGLLASFSAELTLGLLIHKCLRIQGLSVSSYLPEEAQDAWRQIVELLNMHDTRPVVDRVFPFESLPEAFAYLQSGPFGKVLLSLGGNGS